MIYNLGTNQTNSEAGLIHAGQVLHFSIYDPDRGQYVDKKQRFLQWWNGATHFLQDCWLLQLWFFLTGISGDLFRLSEHGGHHTG
ncbi:MAG: hypothetical protein ACLVAW_29735 [Eisenbergiella massiliensis]